LQQQRSHVSLLADPPGSQLSGALLTLLKCYKDSSEGEVKAGVDDDVEDGIDVAVGVHVGDGAVFVSGLRGLYRCWG
jgi:hypothetical protein